jgi:type 1 glutamine amidotransferase
MSDSSLDRRRFVKLATGAAFALPALARAGAEAQQPGFPKRPDTKKALFVYGGWPGHEPTKCRDLFVPWLKSKGFEVEIWTMGTIEKEPLKGLLTAVKNGTGMAGWHGGMGDAYRQETEYRYMVGGDWVAHPGGIVDYDVQIIDHEDPVTAGLSDFKVKSEQYLMHVNPNNKVLATTTFNGAIDPWIDGYTMPVAWKKVYGRGRIFYTSLGHTANVFDIPEALTIAQRGMLWASESRYEPTPNLVSPVYPRR